MDELQERITNLTSNEEARYFYHFTNASGDKILEEGAFLDFEGVGAPDYIVDSNNLLGYIDLENLELITNEYASVLSDNLYLD